ncbi:SGNH/GDSL hydrolase family protein [Marinobacter salinisoli]|uniref:SGNH/GDSL hydrolase family protein n=1 Tax=Marinobacter salinisoli TaxID=2769486 RepID=A0ABX7MVE9_9GAMM|nr:SGNH/GDSL hydrolase family protein [Marinobacter salinisoli]QSP96367.1 SGNH/GDSL hydrolase family protein [Marinobacter salinisoli]
MKTAIERLTYAAILWFFVLSGSAHAQYSQIFVFGDSLSDNGNLKAFLQSPTLPERFTNGPVAMELVAAQLGLSLKPSFHLLPPAAVGGQYGNNYAVAGAIAIDEDGDESTFDINLPTQVNLFLALNGNYAPSDALYVVFIGGNDLFDIQDLLLTEGFNGPAKALERLDEAARSVDSQIRKLASAGARHFLLVNAPDVGATPLTDIKVAQALPLATNKYQRRYIEKLPSISRLVAQIYNTGLAYIAESARYDLGVQVTEFSLFGFLDDTIANAVEYGYTNTEDACIFLNTQGGAPNPMCDVNSFVFFDEIHPTAVTHQRAAAAVLEALAN